MRAAVVLFLVFFVLGTVQNAAILPASQVGLANDPVQQFEEQFMLDASSTRKAPSNGLDLETFTKNAAIRTNQENAVLQQLAFRRNQMFTREAGNRNITHNLAAEMANNDLLNAMILPSSSGHSTNALGFIPTFMPQAAMDKDRIIAELIEQNRRQQLEIHRLVQQNMIRHGRPVLPFMEEGMEMNNQRFGTDFATPDVTRISQTATPRPLMGGNEAMPIMNQIRSVISRNNNMNNLNMAEQMAQQRTQNAVDFEFLKRQTSNPFEPQQRTQNPLDFEFLKRQAANPFEAPQRSPFFEEVTDAFGRRLPLQLKDNLPFDSMMQIEVSTLSPNRNQQRNPVKVGGMATATSTPNPRAIMTESTEKIVNMNENTNFDEYKA